MGLLLRFFKGGLSLSEMMKMNWKDILFWYNIFERQVTEEQVVYDLKFDKNGKERRLPKPEVIRKLVDEKILKKDV